MKLHLIEIGQDGRPAEDLLLSEAAASVCTATAALYQQSGFVRPWIGYLALDGGSLVGTCAFKCPPQEGRVEIAYFTFPEYEGRGAATEMASLLIEKARQADANIIVTAQILPEENASTAILRKLGFARAGTAHDPEVGEVWAWQRNA